MTPANFFRRILSSLPFRGGIRGRGTLSISETESNFLAGVRSLTAPDRDRLVWDRQEVLEQVLEAWRVNPIARRIVGLTSQYVVGGGITATSKSKEVDAFIGQLWNHRLNRFDVRLIEWCDELTRTGNLFVLMSTDSQGFSYFRTIPAQSIDKIESAPNDVEQVIAVYPKATIDNPAPAPWPAFNPDLDSPLHPSDGEGGFPPVILHYTINRPTGAQWGESDLAPMLKWFSRYANWLEDRARLNRYRNSFMFIVKGQYPSEAERISRQRALNATPPAPGSILVCDFNETWEVINPQLQSSDANEDGLALKKMLAAGAGIPLHFLAEPESSTRTTAESAGGPTFRYFEQRQKIFLWIVKDILSAALHRRHLVIPSFPSPFGGMGKGKGPRAGYSSDFLMVSGADISARDNTSLSIAAASIVQVLSRLRDRKLIDDTEYLRMLYRFAGESVDIQDLLERGRSSPDPILTGELEPDPIDLPSPKAEVDGEDANRPPRRKRRNPKGVTPTGANKIINPDSGELKPSAAGTGL